MDAASGDEVHVVDFSSVTAPGKGYTLKVGADTSHPFDIAADTYRKLKYDALAIFYHQRSGIEIAMPYAGGKQWTRPAGHVNVKANDPAKDSPNTGDKAVPCLKDSGCDYKLDVTRGWYDAGDHGKYVVNGGIARVDDAEPVRTRAWRAARRRRFGDGKLAIPEKKNKAPDILDEARWRDGVHAQDAGPRRQAQGGHGRTTRSTTRSGRRWGRAPTRTRSRASCGRRRRRPR